MLTLAFTLALIAQAPSTPPGPDVSRPDPAVAPGALVAPTHPFATARDLSFALAVEEWVCTARAARTLDQVVSRSDADLVRRLACNHYVCRVAAVREIEAKGDSAFRLLFYGRRHRDAQVKFACESIFSTMYLCTFCGGSTRCPHPNATGFVDCWNCTYGGICPVCKGNGLARRFANEPRVFVKIER